MTEPRAEAASDIPAGLETADLVELYRFMRLTRALEERLGALFRQSKLVGGLFRSLGQEGESVATAYALRRRTDGSGDILSPLIRNLGSMLVMGATPLEVFRQYMARGDSPTRGKELNIHYLRPIDEQVAGELEDAVEEAERSPLPPPEEALTEVRAGGIAPAPWTRVCPPDPRRA